MRKIRVYVDTSVFGGIQDEEFAETSKRFFEQVSMGKYVILISQTTLDEISRAPEVVRQLLENLPEENVVQVPVAEEANELAEAYIGAGVLGHARRADATHVAVATVVRADLILSWNFRHLVNYDRIHKFNGVNALNGYGRIEIHSPWEMCYGEEN